jgi:hypothetical protein
VGVNALLRGALAGIGGTMAMSVPVFAMEKLGLFLTAPPVEISASVAEETPVLPEPGEQAFSAYWPVAHLSYGAAAGGLFGVLRRFLPASTPVAGLLFGGAVWAAGYCGFLPALRLYPPPDKDAGPRVATMIAAHVIFGVTTAVIQDRA